MSGALPPLSLYVFMEFVGDTLRLTFFINKLSCLFCFWFFLLLLLLVHFEFLEPIRHFTLKMDSDVRDSFIVPG
jgi:hypothetical protein